MNKKELSEADIRTKFITPALVPPGGKWDLMTQLREEVYFTRGRVIVRGKTVRRGQAKKADYLLYYKPGIPIAVLEAKDNNYSVGAGMQQALAYAETLDLPFAYSSNGDAFLEHDRTAGGAAVRARNPARPFSFARRSLEAVQQGQRLHGGSGGRDDAGVLDDGSGKTPRYYQEIAINRTVEAIARGEKRILLVMATGTGETYTAF